MSEEWTGIKVSEILGKNQISWRRLRNLALAINTSIETEREALKAAQQQILNREARWEEIEKLYKYNLHQLAEVEEHNIRGAIHPDVLAKHIAAATKPLVDTGALLANCAYNLAQQKTLTDRDRHTLDDSRKRWDAALAQVKEGK